MLFRLTNQRTQLFSLLLSIMKYYEMLKSIKALLLATLAPLYLNSHALSYPLIFKAQTEKERVRNPCSS